MTAPVIIAANNQLAQREREMATPKGLSGWIARRGTIGVLPADSEEERLVKASLTLMVCGIVFLAVVWVGAYAAMGLYRSAAIPLLYQMVAVGSLVMLTKTRRFDAFRTTHLVLMLVLPVLLQWSLGGFRASSGVMLWSLIAPLGALVFSPRPLPWFWAYLALVVASGLLEPFLVPARIPVGVNVTFYTLNIGAVSGVAYFSLRHFMRGLAAEREKSERLLLNVLPGSIARRIKAGEHRIADRFEQPAVLFADLVDFTPMSEQLSPEQVVALLDELFSGFDAIAERHGLEKIKTVGDTYMVVGGVPEPRADAEQAVVEMGLEMLELVARTPAPTGGPLQLRIGIDVGPVVAGVIGKRKFAYDVWGDAVNTAARMESHGVPGQIQVSTRAYQRLEHRYRFRHRGPVHVKGKGEIDTYLLVGRR